MRSTSVDAEGSAGRSSTTDQAPLVTLVIAALDEAATIGPCLRSVLSQDHPADRLEVLVYDGGSTDATKTIAERCLADRPLSAVRDNPGRTQAAAWNRGISAARGEIVGILSAHAEVGRGYVSAAVEALERTGADMVGGPVRAEGDGAVAEAIAVATSTPFGAGGARFRLTDREEIVDTVYMGLARAETFRRFLFDEEMIRDQDDELSYRLLDAGAKIVCDPAIRSIYRSRATMRGLAQQYQQYGLWKVRVLQKHPSQVRLRHVIPPAFVLVGLFAAGLPSLGRSGRRLSALFFGIYALADGAAALSASRRTGWRLLPLLAVAYPLLHASYGIGVIRGLIRFRRGWTKETIQKLVAALLGRATR